MPLMNVQAIFPFFTNLPSDVIVNNFHFLVDDSLDKEDVAAIVGPRLIGFYNDVFGTTGANKTAYIDWGQAIAKVFNLAEPPTRVPAIAPIGTTTGTRASTIPTEVACVLSWHAAPQSGVRFQSLYNRIYLGGLNELHMQAGAADQFPRFASTFTAAVATAAQSLWDQNIEDDGMVVWSQVSFTQPLATVRPIVGGWVDNGPDTQRRRSVLATLRNAFTFS